MALGLLSLVGTNVSYDWSMVASGIFCSQTIQAMSVPKASTQYISPHF